MAKPAKGVTEGNLWEAEDSRFAECRLATDVEMGAEDLGGLALFQFNALGRTFRFGPQTGIFGSDTSPDRP
jgi:hypothetical protein